MTSINNNSALVDCDRGPGRVTRTLGGPGRVTRTLGGPGRVTGALGGPGRVTGALGENDLLGK